MYVIERTASTFSLARRNLWQSSLILWRQFTEPYRKTVLGGVWALLLPIIPIAAYVLLRLAVQTSPDVNGIHPVIYVTVGVTLWFLFRDMFMAPVSAIQRQAALIGQTNFPVVGAVMIGFGRALLDTLMRVLFCIPFIIIFAETSPALAGEAILLMVSGTILMLSIGIFVIPLWIILPDIVQVLDVIFRFLIFFSLAIFPLSLSGNWNLVVTANPFAFLIENVRGLAFGDVVQVTPMMILYISGAAILSLFISAYIIGALESRIREMIS